MFKEKHGLEWNAPTAAAIRQVLKMAGTPVDVYTNRQLEELAVLDDWGTIAKIAIPLL